MTVKRKCGWNPGFSLSAGNKLKPALQLAVLLFSVLTLPAQTSPTNAPPALVTIRQIARATPPAACREVPLMIECYARVNSRQDFRVREEQVIR